VVAFPQVDRIADLLHFITGLLQSSQLRAARTIRVPTMHRLPSPKIAPIVATIFPGWGTAVPDPLQVKIAANCFDQCLAREEVQHNSHGGARRSKEERRNRKSNRRLCQCTQWRYVPQLLRNDRPYGDSTKGRSTQEFLVGNNDDPHDQRRDLQSYLSPLQGGATIRHEGRQTNPRRTFFSHASPPLYRT
jgi:hypothetical protein